MELGRGTWLHREERGDHEGSDFERVPFVAWYSHAGFGAANRNQRVPKHCNQYVMFQRNSSISMETWNCGSPGKNNTETQVQGRPSDWHEEPITRGRTNVQAVQIFGTHFEWVVWWWDAACQDYLFASIQICLLGLKILWHGLDWPSK